MLKGLFGTYLLSKVSHSKLNNIETRIQVITGILIIIALHNLASHAKNQVFMDKLKHMNKK